MSTDDGSPLGCVRRGGTLPATLPGCFSVLLNLPACQAGAHAATAAVGSIWATDVPGWITALATVGLLIGAIITAVYAIKAFGKQTGALGPRPGRHSVGGGAKSAGQQPQRR